MIIMSELEKYDVNMKPLEVKGNISYYNPFEGGPFILEGLPWAKEWGKYYRLPPNCRENVSEGVYWLMKMPSGGIYRFRTDAKQIAVRVKNANDYLMFHMTPVGQQGVDLYFKRENETDYVFYTSVKFAAPATEYESVVFQSETKEVRDFLIHLPLYESLDELLIGIDEDAQFYTPVQRKEQGKVVIYGTSITQGGCANRPGMAFTNILSRKLDIEFVNLGFSGSGIGEPQMAEYIRAFPDTRLVILDYDANGGENGYLEKHMDEIVDSIREKHPSVPILILSKTPFATDYMNSYLWSVRNRLRKFMKDLVERRKRTDPNIYFFDGNLLFGEEDIYEMTVDGLHPTDLGFYMMAKVLYPILKELLYK